MDPVGFMAVFGAFAVGPIIIWLRGKARIREKELELQAQRQLTSGTQDENKLLRERVENLESIVCSVDFELNQKLAKVIDEQRSQLVLPAGAGTAGSPVPTTGGSSGTSDAGRAGAAAASAGGGLDRTATAMLSPTPRTATGTSIEPGQILAERYKILRLLGRGGMGAVYLADDEVLNEQVALKVISSAFAADEQAMTLRFRREAAAARKVSSPNVIRIHDLGEARKGLLYLSMEYFQGKTLAEVIAARGVVPLEDARDMLRQIATGLDAAHAAGIVHRDLKPSNVLVGERGAVKIIDFGLATTAMAEGLTATGAILGTPHYMAPEQVRGKQVDARTDIYALGALAYHLVCGRPPFSGDNAIAIGFAHLSEPAPAPKTIRKELSDAMNDAILAALAKSPADRPASATEFVAAACR